MSRSARNDNPFPSEKVAGIHRAAGPAAFTAEPRRVLIVDDNVDAANTLSLLLGMQGHLTKVAYSAEEALACTEEFNPDVGLLDIGLPRTSGYELARQMRANPQLTGVRLIAVTGYGRAEDRRRSSSAGFDEHLVKPVDLATLERALGACAARTKTPSKSDGPPLMPPASGEH